MEFTKLKISLTCEFQVWGLSTFVPVAASSAQLCLHCPGPSARFFIFIFLVEGRGMGEWVEGRVGCRVGERK